MTKKSLLYVRNFSTRERSMRLKYIANQKVES